MIKFELNTSHKPENILELKKIQHFLFLFTRDEDVHVSDIYPIIMFHITYNMFTIRLHI